MENNSEGTPEGAPVKPITVDLWNKYQRDVILISPSGKGTSFSAEILRKQNPGMTVVEIEVEQQIDQIINREPESYSKMNKDLTPELLEKACEVLSSCTRVILNPDQLESLIDGDPLLCFSLVLNGPNDTEVRENLVSALSEKLIGKSWGNYGDKEFDLAQFEEQVKVAALKEGYSVESEN